MSDITWGTAVNVTTTASSVTKTSVVADWDTWAISNRFIKGDGYAQVTVVNIATNRMFGLAETPGTTPYLQINYCVQINTTAVNIIELGVTVHTEGAGFLVSGDTLKITKTGTTVVYSKNSVDFHTSATASTNPLLLKTLFYTVGGYLSGIFFEGAATEILRAKNSAVLMDVNIGAVPVSGAGTRWMWAGSKSALRAGAVTSTYWNDGNVGSWNTSFGYDTLSAGNYAFSVGHYANASGLYSTAFGYSGYAALLSEASYSQWASGSLAGAYAHVRVYAASADAAVTTLSLDGAGAYLVIPTDSSRDFVVSAVTRCIAGTDIGLSASWTQFGTIENTGGTVRLVGSPFNLLTDGTLSTGTWTPKGTSGDAGLAAMTLVPSADDANNCLVFTFTGHAGASANTWHTVVTVHFAHAT
jgi:hypothetical protein